MRVILGKLPLTINDTELKNFRNVCPNIVAGVAEAKAPCLARSFGLRRVPQIIFQAYISALV